jgi:hypothetical protein
VAEGIMNTRGLTKWLVLSALITLSSSGCGDATGGRCAISGTVRFQGKPLDQGNILFIPVASTLATQAGTSITKGTYAIPKMQGLLPGRYKVSISSGDGETPAGPTDRPPGPSGNFSSQERIPRNFNVESTQEVDVKQEGSNQFDFDIP